MDTRLRERTFESHRRAALNKLASMLRNSMPDSISEQTIIAYATRSLNGATRVLLRAGICNDKAYSAIAQDGRYNLSENERMQLHAILIQG